MQKLPQNKEKQVICQDCKHPKKPPSAHWPMPEVNQCYICKELVCNDCAINPKQYLMAYNQEATVKGLVAWRIKHILNLTDANEHQLRGAQLLIEHHLICNRCLKKGTHYILKRKLLYDEYRDKIAVLIDDWRLQTNRERTTNASNS